jgi:ABC-type Fe3+/spermidine/putrescine transport system ATPase subunit
MIRVVADELVKRYDRVAVIDGVSLEVPPGELTYVVGPSGSGKSILARLLVGLERPDAGEIYLDGRPAAALAPAERKAALTFPDDALWPHLTVSDNVGYGLRVRGLSRRERQARVAESLGSLRIDSLGRLRPGQLGLEQRRRVALARAIATEPDLLVLDEPLAGLEGRARAALREEIRRLHAERTGTIVVMTDDPRDALACADRLAVLDLGRVVQVGPPGELYNAPADTFVAQYLGPVNLLHGQIDSVDGRGEAVVRTPLGRLVGRLAGAEAEAAAVGQPVTVAIRPESIELGSNVPARVNRFPATVERQAFLGELRRVYLRGPGDWPVEVLLLQAQGGELRQGQGVTACVPAGLVVVLPSRHATGGA